MGYYLKSHLVAHDYNKNLIKLKKEFCYGGSLKGEKPGWPQCMEGNNFSDGSGLSKLGKKKEKTRYAQ